VHSPCGGAWHRFEPEGAAVLILDLVEGAEKVEQVFGGWPRFHDAHVLDLAVEPEVGGRAGRATVRFVVHAFRMTSAVDDRGYFVLTDHVLVRFALHSAEVVAMEGFEPQNTLFELRGSRPAEPAAADLAVQFELDSVMGVTATFQCARAEVS
jgi:hypothetical protein